MRKRELQSHLDAISAELEAANAELHRMRDAQRRLEAERVALQSELDTERFVQRAMPGPAVQPQVAERAPEPRIVQLQGPVSDERPEEGSGDAPIAPDEEAWHRSIRDRLTLACRDAENLLAVADPSPVVRAARYALAFALRDSQRMAGEGPFELEAGEGGPGAAIGLPAGEPASPLEPGASG